MRRYSLKLTTVLLGIAAVTLVLALELSEWGVGARASGGTSAPAPAPAEPSQYELRERYQKRLQQKARDQKNQSKQVDEAPVVTIEDLQKLHTALKQRQATLDEREKAQGLREKELASQEQVIQSQLGQYEVTLSKLREQLKSLESTAEDKVVAFRQVYERMDPKRAARILNKLDTEMAGKVLAGMKQQQAAEILAKMDPDKARLVTQKFLSGTAKPDPSAILSP